MTAHQAKRPRILILNAALAGDAGNTSVALERLRKAFVRKAEVRAVTLSGCSFPEVMRELAWAEGLFLGRGRTGIRGAACYRNS